MYSFSESWIALSELVLTRVVSDMTHIGGSRIDNEKTIKTYY